MNEKVYKIIGDEIRRIVEPDRNERFPVMSGIVKDVDEGNGTCIVKLSVDEEATPTEGVLLSSVSLNNNGFILIPANNSNVLVAEIDGPGKWSVIKCSTLVKSKTTIGGAVLTQTSAGFSIKVGTKDFKVVMNDILEHIMQLTVPAAGVTSGVPLNITDFANDLTNLNSILI